jgi:hypothetical protein
MRRKFTPRDETTLHSDTVRVYAQPASVARHHTRGIRGALARV